MTPVWSKQNGSMLKARPKCANCRIMTANKSKLKKSILLTILGCIYVQRGVLKPIAYCVNIFWELQKYQIISQHNSEVM